MALLAVLRLGQVGPLVIGLARLVVQLTAAGRGARLALRNEQPGRSSALIALVMLLASAHTVGSRQKAAGGRSGSSRSRAMASGRRRDGGLDPAGAAARAVVRPRMVIPLLGMILGNSVTAVALAAERLASELRADRDLVELRLALGATARQAATPALRSAVGAALTPIINNMMIAGIVSIPGMTTGQLLAGADVQEAIRYQILIYLGIAATVVLSTIILLFVRLRALLHPWAQLRIEELGTSEIA